jgi:hypothetical protein
MIGTSLSHYRIVENTGPPAPPPEAKPQARSPTRPILVACRSSLVARPPTHPELEGLRA